MKVKKPLLISLVIFHDNLNSSQSIIPFKVTPLYNNTWSLKFPFPRMHFIYQITSFRELSSALHCIMDKVTQHNDRREGEIKISINQSL